MSLADLLRRKIPLGKTKDIAIPMNEVNSEYLSPGEFIRLRGYSGAFRIIYSLEGGSGLYSIKLRREDTSREYNKIPTLKGFFE